MDKVKIALAVLKKYHFWVLCGLIVLISLGVWATATAELAAQFAARTDQLNASFKSVETIPNLSPHPNRKVIDAINGGTGHLKQDVLGAWQTLYQEQTQKNQLAAALTDAFKREFHEGGEISWQHLTLYQTFILSRFETLFNDILNVYRPVNENASIVPDVRRPVFADDGDDELEGMDSPPGMGMGGRFGRRPTARGAEADQTPKMTGIVKWEERFALRNSFDWLSRPTTEQVRDAQEDLWVYEALLRVIRDTNLDPAATEPIEHHNAAVREILSLKIGGETFGLRGGEFVDEAKAQSRYVDQNGQPLVEGSPHPAEYDIMPIQMVLSMDQSKIPKLLVECGNSNMPIEVRDVRVRSEEGELPTGETYIPVSIQGLIYIYNKPDSMRLGTGTLAESPEATPEVATPPATDVTPDPAPEPDPAAGGPAAGDPAAGDPAAGGPAAGDPAAGGPAAGDPAAGGPAAGGPAAGGPASAEAPITDPMQE